MGVDNQQTYDINGDFVSLEFVVCPLRGLCKDEGILCCPKIKSSFNPAEQEVAILYASGFTIKEIALKLKKSLSTVNNQMWRITKRLGLNSRHEFIQVVKNLNLL
jgi:DNA-binding NarL/FixJ family response regulator